MPYRPSPRRLAPMLGLLALLLALQVDVARAGVGWCRADPVFEVGGRRGHVVVASLEELWDVANGPIKVVITVPKGVNTRLISTDRGFGHGYDSPVAFAGPRRGLPLDLTRPERAADPAAAQRGRGGDAGPCRGAARGGRSRAGTKVLIAHLVQTGSAGWTPAPLPSSHVAQALHAAAGG